MNNACPRAMRSGSGLTRAWHPPLHDNRRCGPTLAADAQARTMAAAELRAAFSNLAEFSLHTSAPCSRKASVAAGYSIHTAILRGLRERGGRMTGLVLNLAARAIAASTAPF